MCVVYVLYIVIKSYRMYDFEQKEITLKSFISIISLFMPFVSSAYTSISEPPLKKKKIVEKLHTLHLETIAIDHWVDISPIIPHELLNRYAIFPNEKYLHQVSDCLRNLWMNG